VRSWRVLYTISLVVTSLGLGAFSTVALMVFDLNSRLHGVDISGQTGTTPAVRATTVAPRDPMDPFSGRAINIAVFGTDSREGGNAKIATDNVGGVRSDVAMIVHVSARRDRIDIVSIPRDTTVTIPPCQLSDGTMTGLPWTTKFNAAFSRGGEKGSMTDGAACAIKTIQEVSDIRIDEYAIIDFTGFIKMINALGGVDMCIDHRMASRDAKLDLEPGCHHLKGKTALAYARARTGEGLGDGSDLGRIDRQHELLSAIFSEVNKKNLLTSGPSLYHFLQALADSIVVSPGLDRVQEIAGFALSLRGIGSDRVEAMTAPYAGDPNDDANVILTSEATKVFDALAEDRPLPGSKAAKAAKKTAQATRSPSPTVGAP